jgi:hypothetical protein
MLDLFNENIEIRAAACKSYIEAVVDFAEEKEVDFEDIVELLHPQIIEKLKIEFIQKNHFPNKKLPNSIEQFMKD